MIDYYYIIEVFILKRLLIILLCFTILFSMSACKKINSNDDSALSSDILLNESIITESQPNTSLSDTDSNKTSSPDNTTTNNSDISNTSDNSDIEEVSSSTATSNDGEGSYTDIVCITITDFQQVAFSIKDSSTSILLTLPRDWEFEKTNGGYTILKNSKSIGHVTTSIQDSSNEKVNAFTSQLNTNNIKVTHNIDQIVSKQTPSYTRTFCYNYKDENGKNQSIVITIPYQEIDSSATYKMITEANLVKTATSTNLGVLQINDNRKRILILGNSFIHTSQIGQILDTMCGNEASVEAHSRGNSHVETYTNDAGLMQKIRSGNYSVVFICGLYNQVSFDALQQMINACKESNTKLAVFPAHNENQQNIERVMSMYPDTIFINWKAEINSLISTGIDVSNFCIPDAHNHSTPLAGYVGAHMIYRAVFNKIPQTTHFTEVSQTQIDLLGNYATTGTVVLLDNNSIYELE